MRHKMGNHSDTGELLEEARMVALTDENVSFGDTFIDEFGNTIKLDQSPEELANPTRLKDNSNRYIDLIRNELPNDGNKLILKEVKSKKKKAS